MSKDARAFQLFDQAMDLDSEARTAFLQKACGGDEALFSEVIALIDAADAVEHQGFLEPIVGVPHQAVDPNGFSGHVVGPYKVGRRVGRGGMGEVHEAFRRDDTEMRVAIKFLSAAGDDPAMTARFERERRILAGLHHPFIAKLLDGGQTVQGVPYMVMEFVEGVPLPEYCQERNLGLKARLMLLLKVCDGVGFAHRNLVIHRDLKPSNIMVDTFGNPKILDFGIAGALSGAAGADSSGGALSVPGETATRTGLTPAFASPEQIRGERLTAASDVYSLGVLAFLLLTGRLPHDPEGESLLGFFHAVCEKDVPEPYICAGDGPLVPPWRSALKNELGVLLKTALAKEPQRRYASVDAFAQDIRAYLENRPLQAVKEGGLYRTRKFVLRNKAVVLVVMLVLMSSIWTAFSAYRIRHERDLARTERDAARQALSFMSDVFQAANPEKPEQTTARELLARGSSAMTEDKISDPMVRGLLLSELGAAHRALGLTDQAALQLEEAATLLASTPGSDVDEARVKSRLSLVRKDQGRLDEAERLVAEAVSLLDRKLDRDDPKRAVVLNEWALVLTEVGRHSEAETAFLEARRLWEIQDRSAGLAAVLNNLGLLYKSQGRYQEAEQMFRQALEVFRELHGENHVDVATALNNLGLVQKQQGNLQATADSWSKALAVRRAVYPEDHPALLRSLNNMGALYKDLGRLAEAESVFSEVIEAKSRRLGVEHPSYALSLNNLALVYMASSRFSEARRLLQKANEVMAARLPQSHVYVLVVRRNLADCLFHLGELEAALRLAREAVAGFESRHPKGSGHRAQAEFVLGKVLSRSGLHDEARDYLLKAKAYFSENEDTGDFLAQIDGLLSK